MHTIVSLFMKITKKYMKLLLKEECYQYIVLPNEFLPTVRVFTKLLTLLFKYLRSKGHLFVRYIDDSLFLGETFGICFKNIRATVALLRDLGFTIRPEKINPGSYVTNNIPMLSDRLKMTYCQNDNNSD